MGVNKDKWIIPHRLDQSDVHRWPSTEDVVKLSTSKLASPIPTTNVSQNPEGTLLREIIAVLMEELPVSQREELATGQASARGNDASNAYLRGNSQTAPLREALPSDADLDAVAEEQRIKELTNGETDQQGA